MEPGNIFEQKHTGKLMISHIYQEKIEREVAFFPENVSVMLNN